MTDGLFEGMDAPRPLPDDLRARLEEQLLGSAARPLDASLDARLASTLSDPVASALHELDAPRALVPGQRSALERSLVRRRRVPWLAGAAASVVVLAAAGWLVLGGGNPRSPQQLAGSRPALSATPQPPAAGGGGLAGGVEVPARVPTPVPGALGAGTADGLTYSSAARLVVAPATAPARSVVRLSGADLRTAVRVLFGGRPADDLVVHADATVSVRVPDGPAPGSTVDVTVVLSDGRRLTAPQGFRYRAA